MVILIFAVCPTVQEIAKGKAGRVLGADVYGPAHLEETHLDFSWYGIHGVEMLFTIMGLGCKSVTRTHTADSDVVVGLWDDNRIGTFRGIRCRKYLNTEKRSPIIQI